jgi:putative flippase GtrA
MLSLLLALEVHPNLASAAAIELSILSNFVLNDLWTFRDLRAQRTRLSRLGRFHLVSLFGGLLQLATFVAMNALWAVVLLDLSEPRNSSWVQRWVLESPPVGNWAYLSQICGIGVATLWNYLCNFYWTWGKR